MLTRRENLLIRPWQERRYIQHRKKVKAALPAIDNSPPPLREHVCNKLKKVQKESERCTQIISDNFTLLQHLSGIMSTTRVDHFWEEPPPNFLQRVGIYTSDVSAYPESEKEEQDEFPPPTTRKEKCYACSPLRYKLQVSYDVRRPYTPPKQRISRKPEPSPDWESQFKSLCDEDKLEFRGKMWNNPPNGRSKKNTNTKKILKKKRNALRENNYGGEDELEEENQSLILTRGELSVAVKFPSHTGVIFNTSTHSKQIQKTFCECKAFPRIWRKKVEDSNF